MSKAKAKTYKSEAMAAVHEMMEGLSDAGSIDKRTMREAEHVSQPVFARYLNVSKNLVSDWERGAKKPGGPALRLLSIIQRNGLDAVA
jgi:putative transcriptional regulator